jgi:hypothetical protein
MAWIYLAGLAELQRPFRDTPIPSRIAKTTDTHNRSSYLEWLQATFPKHQSGMTLEHLEAIWFHPLTLSTEDSPAKTLAVQDLERAWKESEADYFLRSQGSLARYDHDSCSWKMFQLLIDGEETLSSELWPTSGMTVDGTCYPLRMWARITDEKDGGCWPTPRGRDDRRIKVYANSGNHGDLNQEVAKSNPELIGGQLNPTWVEWLMGYPGEWTASEDWAMRWCRPRRVKRLKG